jgi:hypothetical protein
MGSGRDQAYDAEPVVCHATAARERAERAFREQNNGEPLPGLRWRVHER